MGTVFKATEMDISCHWEICWDAHWEDQEISGVGARRYEGLEDVDPSKMLEGIVKRGNRRGLA